MRVGPLQRTLQSADEILSAGETLSGKKLASRKIDERLREVDYGLWGGLTRKATVERFGEESVRAYEVEGKFPTGAGWPESEETIRARVLSLIRELETDRDEKKNWILVSSQGILRFFLDPVDLADRLRTGRHKIRTGAVALFERSTLPSSRWELQFWDLRPEEVKN
jgi:probable phosphoglycerate mutase